MASAPLVRDNTISLPASRVEQPELEGRLLVEYWVHGRHRWNLRAKRLAAGALITVAQRRLGMDLLKELFPATCR